MADWGDAFVRVTGVRRQRFVEFEFSLGDELVVELVMPYHEFRTFCDEHSARVLPSEGEAALAFMALSDQESN
jgi:phenol hydroxylase P0 protein